MPRYRRATWFFLSALALVALLTALPPSGWLVRTQLRLIVGGNVPGFAELRGDSTGPARAAAVSSRIRSAAAASPDDYATQLAAALETAPANTEDGAVTGPDGVQSGTVRSLLPLRARFDAQPGLHADILRFLCSGDLRLDRQEERLLASPRKETVSVNVPKPSAPAVLALAEAEAARGEALDPQNAFFPMMHAAALFEARRDAEALMELHRAALLSATWNDYSAEETRARLKLSEASFGRTGAIAAVATQASILLPDYACVRGAARVAVALAALREQAGDTGPGFVIRRDVARVGAIMRASPSPYIGNLVGAAVTRTASARPGGAAPLPEQGGEALAAERDARYVAYLSRIGHPEEARWYLAERRAQEQQKAIFKQAESESLFGLRSLLWLTAWWCCGVALLVSALWTLVLGGCAAGFAKTARVRSGRPLHRAVRWGFGLSALLPAAAYLANAALGGPKDDDRTAFFLFGACALVQAVPLFVLKRGESWRGFGGNLAICAGTVAASCALAGAAAASLGFLPQLGSVFGVFTGCAASDSPGSVSGSDGAVALLLACSALFVPLVLIVILAIRSRVRRVPASVGVVRGFRAAALPLAGVLLLLYAGAVRATLIEEQFVRAQVMQILDGEGEHYASLVGATWPGPVTGAESGK